MELSFGVGTLLKMCNEPRTIDFQARGLTGRDRRNILSLFFKRVSFSRFAPLACLVSFTRLLFPSTVCLFFFSCFSVLLEKTTTVLVSFYALFYSSSSKPPPNASCSFLFFFLPFFPSFYFYPSPVHRLCVYARLLEGSNYMNGSKPQRATSLIKGHPQITSNYIPVL